jgi:hypothetical protein
MRLFSLFAALLAAAVVFAPGPARATGKLSGAAPFVCVPTSVRECGNDGDCERGIAQSEGLPQFFSIDINAKTLGGGEKDRQSKIERVNRIGNKTVLYGADGERSWIVIINTHTGNLSSTVTGRWRELCDLWRLSATVAAGETPQANGPRRGGQATAT